MTPAKVLQVIQFYRSHFEKYRLPKNKKNPNTYTGLEYKPMWAHCHAMLDEMEQFVKSDRMEKCFRWLGFIQGVLWTTGEFTLNDLKNHSRPDEDKNE